MERGRAIALVIILALCGFALWIAVTTFFVSAESEVTLRDGIPITFEFEEPGAEYYFIGVGTVSRARSGSADFVFTAPNGSNFTAQLYVSRSSDESRSRTHKVIRSGIIAQEGEYSVVATYDQISNVEMRIIQGRTAGQRISSLFS
ncbi:MAG: hypothetical protein ACMXYM_03300 [Candidatus Woesearchaeota archaeon]